MAIFGSTWRGRLGCREGPFLSRLTSPLATMIRIRRFTISALAVCLLAPGMVPAEEPSSVATQDFSKRALAVLSKLEQGREQVAEGPFPGRWRKMREKSAGATFEVRKTDSKDEPVQAVIDLTIRTQYSAAFDSAAQAEAASIQPAPVVEYRILGTYIPVNGTWVFKSGRIRLKGISDWIDVTSDMLTDPLVKTSFPHRVYLEFLQD